MTASLTVQRKTRSQSGRIHLTGKIHLTSYHDYVLIKKVPQTSTTEYQEQPTRAGTARRRCSLPSLSDSVWSQESLKLDESFTSVGKHKHQKAVENPGTWNI